MTPFNRILLTGAAGRLGSELRAGLAHLTTHLRLSDRVPMGELREKEEHVVCELGDYDAVMEMTRDVDAILHFGGAPDEDTFEVILDSNLRGSYHIYEGARRHGVKRVVYASSNHAMGFHKLEDNVDALAPHRPDTLYGVSKCFVEDLSRLYWDKFGIESVCLRIFSSFAEPTDRRMLWSWLSFRDCVQLVERSLVAPRVGHTVALGRSKNRLNPVSNRHAEHLGYEPQDSAEPYRSAIEAKVPPLDPRTNTAMCLGGWFTDQAHPDDEKNKN